MVSAAGLTVPAGSITHRRRRVGVFEPEVGGHQWEHLRYILEAWMTVRERDCDLVLVVHPELQGLVQQFLGRTAAPTVSVVPLPPDDVRRCAVRPLWLGAMERWRLIRAHVARQQLDHIHIMHLDHLQLPLAMHLPLGRVACSGVLFRVSSHYALISHVSPRLRERVRDARKGLLYGAMLGHRALRSVLTLDPEFPEYAARKWRNGWKVAPIVDPLPVPAACFVPHVAVRGLRTVLLLFGVLSRRKGVLRLLEALRLVPPEVAERLEVVLAGRVDTGIRAAVSGGVGRLREERPTLALRLTDRFLPDDELIREVARADVVLAPYQRFVGSSGVLAWGAGAGKPVLTQDYGLLGLLVHRYRLGTAVDTTSRSALADAIVEATRGRFHPGFDLAGTRRYVAERTAMAYGQRTLQALLTGGLPST